MCLGGPMPVARLVFSLLLILAVSPLLNSQQSTAAGPERDAQAVAVLKQMTAATGWGTAALPIDGIASGTVNWVSGDTQHSVSVSMKSKGPRVFREDVQDPSEPISTVINGDGGTVTRNGGTYLMPAHSAISQRP